MSEPHGHDLFQRHAQTKGATRVPWRRLLRRSVKMRCPNPQNRKKNRRACNSIMAAMPSQSKSLSRRLYQLRIYREICRQCGQVLPCRVQHHDQPASPFVLQFVRNHFVGIRLQHPSSHSHSWTSPEPDPVLSPLAVPAKRQPGYIKIAEEPTSERHLAQDERKLTRRNVKMPLDPSTLKLGKIVTFRNTIMIDD